MPKITHGIISGYVNIHYGNNNKILESQQLNTTEVYFSLARQFQQRWGGVLVLHGYLEAQAAGACVLTPVFTVPEAGKRHVVSLYRRLRFCMLITSTSISSIKASF